MSEQPLRTTTTRPVRHIILGLLVSLTLYGAYFFDLIRREHRVLLERQEALESLKFLGVPGTQFLHDLGGLFLVKSSLFFLILLGMLLTVALLFSLCLRAPWKRALFFLLLLGGIVYLTVGDRIQVSLPCVTALAFGSFLVITLDVHIRTTWKDAVVLVLLGLVLSSALYVGAGYQFFIKTRDRLLFDSSLGSHVVSYYYTYTPLAASVISPAQGVYEGLVFLDGFKTQFHHLGRGLVLSGEPSVKGAADFILSRNDDGFRMVNRYGDGMDLPSADPENVIAAAGSLFTMNGLKTLSRIALYAFPAGLLIIPFFLLRLITQSRKAFLIMAAAVGFIGAIFIGSISLTGTFQTTPTAEEAARSKSAALALAYDLYDEREVPPSYVPVILEWGSSESIALRYWGAKLLGYCPVNPDHRKRLTDLLADPSPNVRYAAALSMHNLFRVDSFKVLLPSLIKDPNWYVKCIIFSAFLRSGTIPHHM